MNHAPKRFVIENGKLLGMEFEVLEWDEGAKHSTVLETVIIECDDVILAIGQENAFPWIERDLGMEFGEWDMPDRRRDHHAVDTVGGLLWRRRGVWSEEHHLGGRARTRSRDLDPQPLQRRRRSMIGRRLGMNLVSQKMGMAEWSYHNDYNPSPRQKMSHVELTKRFESLDLEVELGFSVEQTVREVQRCLNCDVETAFKASACIECDACIDICPVQCLTITSNGTEEDLRSRLSAPATNLNQALYVSEALPQTGRVMVKDENVCVHCGLCAERCPTAAWDMELFDLHIPYAASANFIRIGAMSPSGAGDRVRS